MRDFLRTTLIGGFLFMIPLVAVVVIIGKAFQILKIIATPIGKLIPIESIAGFAFVEFLTAGIMLLACFVAGLLTHSQWARHLGDKLDAVLLQVVPGYAWIKGVTGGISDEEALKIFKPVLVRLDDQYQLGLEADRNSEGLAAVFLPGAPDARSGVISYVTADRIQPIDVGLTDIAGVCRKLGRDSVAMLPVQSGQ